VGVIETIILFIKTTTKGSKSLLQDDKTYKKLIKRWDSERELFYDDLAHVLQSTAPPPQIAQYGVVTVRTQKYQPEAKRQNITVKW